LESPFEEQDKEGAVIVVVVVHHYTGDDDTLAFSYASVRGRRPMVTAAATAAVMAGVDGNDDSCRDGGGKGNDGIKL